MSTARFIAKVSYVEGHRKKVVYVKLPYGAVFGLTESLARAWAIGLIRWFRIDTIKPGEMTPEIRASLTRWPRALEPILEEVSVG